MSVFKIAMANIKKRKGAGIAFLIVVMLSALMLSISLSLIIGGGDFYDKKAEEFNSPHYSDFIISSSYKDSFRDFAENYEGVTEVSLFDVLFCSGGSIQLKSGTVSFSLFLIDTNEFREKSFQKLTIIDEQAAGAEDSIVLPVSYRANGFKAGETIDINLNGTIYSFVIRGFFEDTQTGASTSGAAVVFIETETFQEFKASTSFMNYVSLSARFTAAENSTDFMTAFNRFTGLNSNEEVAIFYNNSKMAAMVFVDVASLMLVIFSFIILVIALIIARFNINNTIHEDITTIGALKSIGYKNKILRSSQLLQYLMIAAAGSIIGSVISLLTFGAIGDIVASTSGLLWVNSMNIVPVLLSFGIICGFTALVTFMVTRKYKKITPINALRQGESNHSFKKNPMPLNKHALPLNLHLGVKRFCKNLKNGITLFIVVSLLVFISVLVFSISYNFNVDRTAMIQMVGLEMSDVWVQTDPNVDIYELEAAINSHDDVNRTLLIGNAACSIDKIDSYVVYLDDYSALLGNTVIKGRNPELYNEIALGSIMTQSTGKKVGDTVTIEIGGAELSYIVVGITQDIGNAGNYSNITSEAVLRHRDNIGFGTIYVYLKDGINAQGYTERLSGTYGNQIMTINPEEQMDTILSSMGGSFAAISVIMIVITVVIIASVLFLLISALIRKEKKELGIMKAIGYKNRQLIIQMLISMLLPLALGTLLGIILGFAVTNPLLSAAFTTMGILSASFIIPLLPTLLIGLGIFCASVLTSGLISLRLKKVSPQKLITE